MPQSTYRPQSRRGIALSLFALLVVGLLTADYASRASAQQATGFIGAVIVDGRPAGIGTRIEVFINGAPAGATVVVSPGSYVVDLSDKAAKLGEDMDGAGVSFRVNGVATSVTSVLRLDQF